MTGDAFDLFLKEASLIGVCAPADSEVLFSINSSFYSEPPQQTDSLMSSHTEGGFSWRWSNFVVTNVFREQEASRDWAQTPAREEACIEPLVQASERSATSSLS